MSILSRLWLRCHPRPAPSLQSACATPARNIFGECVANVRLQQLKSTIAIGTQNGGQVSRRWELAQKRLATETRLAPCRGLHLAGSPVGWGQIRKSRLGR